MLMFISTDKFGGIFETYVSSDLFPRCQNGVVNAALPMGRDQGRRFYRLPLF